jgi:hypothetical protein
MLIFMNAYRGLSGAPIVLGVQEPSPEFDTIPTRLNAGDVEKDSWYIAALNALLAHGEIRELPEGTPELVPTSTWFDDGWYYAINGQVVKLAHW